MKISVITPVYNREDCIQRCLESVAANNAGGGRVEHVVVDDGSTDGSAAIAESFAATHPDVKFIRLPRNMGPNAARNAAVAAATGEFVLLIDSDDLLAPGAIDVIEKVISEEPGYDQYLLACSHNADATSRYGERHIFSFQDFLTGAVNLDFAHIINRETVLSLPFDESLRIYEYLFHLRFYKKADKILFVNKVVSIVDTERNDHVTFSTRKTTDRALEESAKYTDMFIEWFSEDLLKTEAGRAVLRNLKTDSYQFAVLSGDYAKAKAIAAEGLADASSIYRLAALTHSGRVMWRVAKNAMKMKWFLRDLKRRK